MYLNTVFKYKVFKYCPSLRMWSTIRQEWAKRDIFEVGPEGELTELALLRSLTCRVRRMKSFICQSWATYCVFVGHPNGEWKIYMSLYDIIYRGMIEWCYIDNIYSVTIVLLLLLSEELICWRRDLILYWITSCAGRLAVQTTN